MNNTILRSLKQLTVYLIIFSILFTPLSPVFASPQPPKLNFEEEKFTIISPLDGQYVQGDYLALKAEIVPTHFSAGKKDIYIPNMYKELVVWINGKVNTISNVEHSKKIQDINLNLTNIPDNTFSLQVTLHTFSTASIFKRFISKWYSEKQYTDVVKNSVSLSSPKLTIHRLKNLTPPSDTTYQSHVGGGTDGMVVETKEYTGFFNAPFDENKFPLQVIGGPELSKVPIKNNKFGLKLNTENTALILATDSNNKPVLMDILPKHPYIARQNPILDANSTAKSLLFLQPGFFTNDPLIATILLQIIQDRPETAEFAYILDQKLKQNPNTLTDGDIDVASAWQNANMALKKFFDDSEKSIQTARLSSMIFSSFIVKPVLATAGSNCDSNTTWFKNNIDIAKEVDNVCITTSGSGSDNPLLFESVNNLPRWVFRYLDTNNNGQLEVSPNNFFIPQSLSLPRHISFPSLQEQFFDIIVVPILKTSWRALWNGDKVSLDTVISEARGKIQSYYQPQTEEWTLSRPIAGNYYLTSYSFGSISSIPDFSISMKRQFGPIMMTCTTELILPLIEITADIDIGKLLHTKLNPEKVTALGNILSEISDKVDKNSFITFVTYISQQKYSDALLQFIDITKHVFSEAAFWKIITLFTDKEVASQIGLNILSNTALSVFIPWQSANKFIQTFNIGMTFYLLYQTLADYSSFDKYSLVVSALEPSSTPTLTPTITPTIVITNTPTPTSSQPQTVTNWPTQDHDGGHTRYVQTGPKPPFEMKWSKNMNFILDFELLAYNGLVYVPFFETDGTRSIGVFDGNDGSQKWKYHLPDDDCTNFSGDAIADNTLLVRVMSCGPNRDKAYLRGINATTGEKKWMKEWPVYMKFEAIDITSKPASANDRFYVSRIDGVAPINPANGDIGSPYATSNYFFTPVVDESNIYGFVNGNTFTSMALTSYNSNWSADKPYPKGKWAVGGNVVYITSFGRYARSSTTFLLDKSDGHVLRQYTDNDGVMAISSNNFLMNTLEGFAVYNPQTGNRKWLDQNLAFNDPVIVADQYLITSIACHMLSVRDINSGEELYFWTDPNKGQCASFNENIVTDNWVYALTNETLYGFKGQ